MRHDCPAGRPTSGSAQNCRHHWYQTQQLHTAFITALGRKAFVFGLNCRGHVGPSSVDQVDHRNSVLPGHILHKATLSTFTSGKAGAGAATYREILTTNRHPAAINLGQTHDIWCGNNVFKLAPFPCGFPGQLPDFLKGTRFGQFIDSLPHSKLALFVVTINPFLSSKLKGHLPSQVYFFYFRFPTHFLKPPLFTAPYY